MAIFSSIMIRGSVGVGGRNEANDVRAVQQQLNGLMRPPRAKLATDGRCGPKTCGMIADFQRAVVELKQPDSRVDPIGRTIRALNDAASEGKWARMSIAPPAPPPVPGGNLTPVEQNRLAALRKAVASDPALAPAKDVLDLLANTCVPVLKTILNWANTAQYGTELLRAIAQLRRAGTSAQDVVELFRLMKGLSKNRFDDMLSLLVKIGGNARLSKIMGVAGNVANFVQVLATAVQVTDLFRQGQYGQGFAEIYGCGMGIAIPWAGFVNAVQELVFAANPNLAGNPRLAALFKFVIALDPISCGKTAVDTVVTLLSMAAKRVMTGEWNERDLDELARRMKASPMRFWTEIGDYLGDAAFNFVKWLRS